MLDIILCFNYFISLNYGEYTFKKVMTNPQVFLATIWGIFHTRARPSGKSCK